MEVGQEDRSSLQVTSNTLRAQRFKTSRKYKVPCSASQSSSSKVLSRLTSGLDELISLDLQTSRLNMVFGRDKTKQDKASKAIQYPTKSQAPASRPADVYQRGAPPYTGIDPYQQRPVANPSRAGPYHPNAYSYEGIPSSQEYLQRSSPPRALEPRNYQPLAHPYSASGAAYPGSGHPPLPMPASQYSVPLPYRSPPQRAPQYRPQQVPQEAQRSRPKIRMFSQKTYEQEARKDAWDKGVQEYIRAERRGKRRY